MEQNQLQVKVRDEEMRGAYSNLMQVLHTKEEFILDFFFNAPPQGILASRIILSPAHAKRTAMALMENVKKYEEQFGKIAEVNSPKEERIGFVN